MSFPSNIDKIKAIRLFAFSAVLLFVLQAAAPVIGFESILWQGVFLGHLILFFFALLESFTFLVRILQRAHGSERLAIGVSFLVFLAIVFLALSLPITARDALVHHLALPKWWFESGNTSPIWWHEWSFYPSLIHHAYLGFFTFELENYAVLYHAAFLLFLGLELSRFVYNRSQSTFAASLAICLSFLLPIFLRLSGEPLVDLPLACFAALAFICLIELAEDWEWKKILLAGIFLGLCLGTKYNALLFAFVFLPLGFLFLLRKQKIQRAVLASLAMSLIAAILLSPLLIQNINYTGNPIYPLMAKYLGGGLPGNDLIQGIPALMKQKELYGESYFFMALLPFRLLFWGEDHNPAAFDGLTSPLLLAAYLSIFCLRRRSYLGFGIMLVFLYSLAFPSFSSVRVRYLAPVLGVVVLLSVDVFLLAYEKIKARSQFVGPIFFLLLFVTQLSMAAYYLSGRVDYLRVKEFVSGKYSQAEYIQKFVPDYSMSLYVNEKLPADSKVYLFFTGNRFYYYQKPIRSAGYRSERELLVWLQQSETASDLAKIISEKESLTHLLYQHERFQEVLNLALSDEKKHIWLDFQKNYLHFIHGDNGYALWKIQHFPQESSG